MSKDNIKVLIFLAAQRKMERSEPEEGKPKTEGISEGPSLANKRNSEQPAEQGDTNSLVSHFDAILSTKWVV